MYFQTDLFITSSKTFKSVWCQKQKKKKEKRKGKVQTANIVISLGWLLQRERVYDKPGQ